MKIPSSENANVVEIRNKLQATSVVLERVKEGQEVPKKFIELALRDFEEAVRLLNEIK